ncbi:MAG: hypothetical protein GXP31_16245 [Kiritimatiellaeota bacterium]|nr:hypothetical protein [Kiritimatiellota bacterium]
MASGRAEANETVATEASPERQPGAGFRLTFRWFRRFALASGIVLGAGVTWFYVARRPWIEPMPGVRLGPTPRRFPSASSPGQQDARRAAVIRACRLPEAIGWQWSEVRWKIAAKLDHQPWPANAEKPLGARKLASETHIELPTQPPNLESSLGAVPEFPSDQPWTRHETREVGAILDFLVPRFRLVRRTLLSGVDFGLGREPEPSTTTDELLAFRAFHSWQNLAVRLYAAEGRKTEMLEVLDTALRFADNTHRGGDLLHRLVSQAMMHTSLYVLWEVDRTGRLPPETRRRFMRLLDTFDHTREPLAEAFRIDLQELREVNLAETLAKYDPAALAKMASWLRSPVYQRKAALVLYLEKWLTNRSRSILRDADAVYSQVIALVERQPFDRKRSRELRNAMYTAWDRPLLVRDYTGLTLLSGILGSVEGHRDKEWELLAKLRGMRLWLAVRVFQQQNGRLPERFAEMVPAIMQAIPTDPFAPTGDFLRYRRLGDGTWAAYSLGPNRLDDGALAERWGSPYVSIPSGDKSGSRDCRPIGDIVFPSVSMEDWAPRVRFESP